MLKKNNITILQLTRLDYNQFEIAVSDPKKFLKICKDFNYQVQEIKLSRKETILRLFKRNFIFVLLSIFVCCSLAIFSNFVFKVQIFGLENVEESVVLEVLNNNGYKSGKFKSSYDLDSLQSILVKNIDKISFATGIIKGSTLVVNVYEKIDNSPYIYDYLPICAPFDCIIKEVSLLSGTIKIGKDETAKEGDTIVAPYIETKDFKCLPTPAKATIKAYIELTESVSLDKNLPNVQILIEELKKKLYNNLKLKTNSYIVEEDIVQENNILSVKLSGIIEF